MHTIRPLSRKIKSILVSSEIASENKTFIWKVDAVNDCLLHDNKLRIALERAQPMLELVSEVYFDLTYLDFDGGNCHKRYENVTEIISALPANFDKRKVSIVHSANPDPASTNKMDWIKCNYILAEERPDMRFKFVALEHIFKESPKFLEFLLKKSQSLQLYKCNFTELCRQR